MHQDAVIDADKLDALGHGSISPIQPPPQVQLPRALDQLASQIRPLAEVERETIERALGLCDGDVRKAAVFLEIATGDDLSEIEKLGH